MPIVAFSKDDMFLIGVGGIATGKKRAFCWWA